MKIRADLGRRRALLACALASSLSCQAPDRGTGAEGPAASVGASSGAAQVRLEGPGTVHAGELVRFAVIVTNSDDQPLEFSTAAAPQDFDLTVSRQTGELVWQRLYQMDLDAPVAVTPPIPPRGTRRYEYAWDQRDIAGKRVVPGRYIVKAVLYAAPPFGDIDPGSVVLTVTP